MGETALKLLSDEASDPQLKPQRIVFQPELVIRASA
jgi:DNA-binding LacI/PurR family transcriptional regulator